MPEMYFPKNTIKGDSIMNNTYIKTANVQHVKNIRRGMVVLVDVPSTFYNPHQHSGYHYYVVVSNNNACKHSPVIQVIPFSSKEKRRLPCHAEITSRCMPKTSCLLGEQLTLLPKRLLQFGEYCGMLEDEQMQLVDGAMKTQLAIA